jgi:vancomycin resistance protein VanW
LERDQETAPFFYLYGWMKKLLPYRLKLFVKLYIRKCRDVLNSISGKFATKISVQDGFFVITKLHQEIKNAGILQNKTKNINLATVKINGLMIYPGQVFSFWKLVGNPSQKKGFKNSRSLINGQLEEAMGGGLCQLSGILYFLALKAGLTIIERHPHSRDIYREEERFTPLGSDATVVYGYKDLRIANPYNFPVNVQVDINEDTITGILSAAVHFDAHEIVFQYTKGSGYTDVTTIQKNNMAIKVIGNDRYLLLTR